MGSTLSKFSQLPAYFFPKNWNFLLPRALFLKTVGKQLRKDTRTTSQHVNRSTFDLTGPFLFNRLGRTIRVH